MPAQYSCLGGLFSQSKSRSFVPGLTVVEDAFTPEQEAELLRQVDASSAPWTRRRTRITKNYGPYYFYSERDTPNGRFRYTDGKVMHTDLPPFLHSLILPVVRDAVPSLHQFNPNQLHVALYRKGEDSKIRMHNDNKMGQIGPYIVGMCLLSDCYMTFVRPRDSRKKVVHLPRRCVYVMSGESHTEWRHGILGGDTPTDRVSFTLRDVRKLAVEEGAQVKKSSHQPTEKSLAQQQLKDAMRREGRVENLDFKLADALP